MNRGQIFIEQLSGQLKLLVRGDHPTHPWEILLTPEAAYSLGTELQARAVEQGHRSQFPVMSRSGADSIRQTPPGRQQFTDSGPQSSADGVPDSFNPRPSPAMAAPEPPLGDDFGDP